MKCFRGWALAKLGQVHNGFEQIRQSLDVVHNIGASNLMPLLSAMYAEVCMDAGRIDEGLAAVVEAHTVARDTSMYHCEAEIHRLKGDLLLQQINRTKKYVQTDQKYKEVENCYERAIEIARHQHAKSFELRATTSLVRFLQKQNRQTEAYERLTGIYHWFTEGYNTPDMLEAGELLKQLS